MPPNPPRLPIPGEDENEWGDILNRFLEVEHEGDGTLKTGGTLGAYAPLANPTFTGSVTVPTPANDNDAASKEYVDDSLAGKANDSDVVKLTGNQTVGGNKTFTGNTIYDLGAAGSIVMGNLFGVGVMLRAPAEAQPRVMLHMANGIAFGPGGSTAPDTQVSRAGVNNLTFNGARLSSVADPTDDQDAATKKYVDESAVPTVTPIDSLPAADVVDGSERVPLSQDGTTVRADLADIIDNLTISKEGGEFLPNDGAGISVGVGIVGEIIGFPIYGVSSGSAESDHDVILGTAISGPLLQLGSIRIGRAINGRLQVQGDTGITFGGDTDVSIGSGWLNMTARTDPDAPPANQARLFHRIENGKSELCVRFPSGAVQVLATEP